MAVERRDSQSSRHCCGPEVHERITVGGVHLSNKLWSPSSWEWHVWNLSVWGNSIGLLGVARVGHRAGCSAHYGPFGRRCQPCQQGGASWNLGKVSRTREHLRSSVWCKPLPPAKRSSQTIAYLRQTTVGLSICILRDLSILDARARTCCLRHNCGALRHNSAVRRGGKHLRLD